MLGSVGASDTDGGGWAMSWACPAQGSAAVQTGAQVNLKMKRQVLQKEPGREYHPIPSIC